LKEDMEAVVAMRAAGAAPGLTPAFEALFRREYPRVVGIAQRIVRDADEAEDVAQDVFVAFYRKHPADAGYAPAWLYAAAAHTALNVIRSRDAEQNEAHAEVRAALARMDERAAALLVLRHSGLSYEEIAAALGLRRSSIGTLLGRAEDSFRKEVTR
jgi:RNA polymerase sigma-70 factor (ECF subfamily)